VLNANLCWLNIAFKQSYKFNHTITSGTTIVAIRFEVKMNFPLKSILLFSILHKTKDILKQLSGFQMH